ncbi:MAG: hypothetical protein HYY96_06590 [Candidatus Tectomicrobia bacterium]|nr:hypothetical protein [Candidatus Tectomicrobia bacterium]
MSASFPGTPARPAPSPAASASRRVTLVSPVSHAVGEAITSAPRTGNLRGKALGILENRKQGAAPILEAVAAQLREEFGVGEIIFRRKRSMSSWAEEEILAELAGKCAAVLVGIGD